MNDIPIFIFQSLRLCVKSSHFDPCSHPTLYPLSNEPSKVISVVHNLSVPPQSHLRKNYLRLARLHQEHSNSSSIKKPGGPRRPCGPPKQRNTAARKSQRSSRTSIDTPYLNQEMYNLLSSKPHHRSRLHAQSHSYLQYCQTGYPYPEENQTASPASSSPCPFHQASPPHPHPAAADQKPGT